MQKRTFIRKYVEAVDKGNAAIFAGAGLSMSQGYVSWSKLLEEAAIDIGLDIEIETDLVTLAQYYKNKQGGTRGLINQMITEEFGTKLKISENHKILASLPIETYWTTNYDHLIEDSIRQAYKNPSVKTNYTQLAQTMPSVDATVYKMHGDVEDVSKTVITRDDYEQYDNETYTLFKETLKGDLLTKTFLFLGFSFTDPNLDRILADIRWVLKDSQRPHYCIMKKIKEEDFPTKDGGFDADKFSYEKIKRKLQINDLQRFSINILEVDAYSDITDILKEIRKEYLKKTIFISGSAVDYSPFDDKTASQFVEQLAFKLAEKDYRIISGFGLGIGSFVVTGVLKQREEQQRRNFQDTLVLRPFPQNTKEAWKSYREEMINDSGISIFLFGNKHGDDGGIVTANGMLQEFDISVMQKNTLIPIGYTGGASRQIYDTVKNDFEKYFEKNELLTDFELFDLKNTEKSIEELVDEIVSFIDKI